MSLEFSGEIWQWRGPAPYYFVTVPAQECEVIKATAKLASYGWGMIPVKVRIGKTEWQTSLFPKEGRYLIPLKGLVRKAEGLEEGNTVTVRLEVHIRRSGKSK